jgi:hypothetical protein
MAIPAKQIGQSAEANLLWQISKQLETLIKVTANNVPTTSTTTTIPAPVTTEATLIYNSTSGGSGYPEGFDDGTQCSANTSINPFITVYYSGSLQTGTAFFSNVELTTPIQVETSNGYWHYKLTSVDNPTGSDVTFNGFSSVTVNTVTACQ